MSNIITYPTNPSQGQEFTVGQTIKVWDGEKWVNKSFGNHERRLQELEALDDFMELKIFQSPTDGGLTEIQTRTIEAGEVYEVRKTSDDSLATIYSDAAGTTEIVQDGTINVSGGNGVVEFYIADGDYYIESSIIKKEFSTQLREQTVSSVEDMISDRVELSSGCVVHTVSYYKGGISGGATYIVMTPAEAASLDSRYSTIDELGFSFTLHNGLVAVLITTNEVYADKLGVSEGIDNTTRIQLALDFIKVDTTNTGGGTLHLPRGDLEVTETLLVKASNNITYGSVYIKGSGRNTTRLIKVGTDRGPSDVNACLHLVSDIGGIYDINNSHNVNISNLRIIGDNDYGIYTSKYCSGLLVEDCLIAGVVTAITVGDIWQSRFKRLDLRGVNGFQIRESGTSNLLESIFVRGTSGVAYELRGNYSAGVNLACDVASGTAYKVMFGDWDLTGVGCESPDLSTVFLAQNGTLTLNNIQVFGLDELSEELQVFQAASGGVIKVNSGNVIASSLESKNMLGALKTQSSAESSVQFLSNISVKDIWPVSKEAVVGVSCSNSVNVLGDTRQTASNLIERSGGQIGFGLNSSFGFSKFADSHHDNPYQRCPMIVTNVSTSPKTRSDGANIEYSRGGAEGDIYLTDSPGDVRGIGWVNIEESTQFVRDGVYKKLPYVDSGISSDRPSVATVIGQSFFDTTLGKPIWLKAVNTWVDANGTVV